MIRFSTWMLAIFLCGSAMADVHFRDVMCASVYEPVCGHDGNSYGNDCEAFRVGVEIKHEGSCVGRSMPRVRAMYCAHVYEPVCGTDGVTYGNKCEAHLAGVEVVHDGDCVD